MDSEIKIKCRLEELMDSKNITSENFLFVFVTLCYQLFQQGGRVGYE